MTKSDLVAQLVQLYPHVDPRLLEDATSLFFFEISNALQRQERVELRGLGTFSLRIRQARKGRNPKTGEAVEVEEKCVPFFKMGKELRTVINEKNSSPPLVDM